MNFKINKFAVAGLDEAGRGAWAGPVVAATVLSRANKKISPSLLNSVRDSKQLSVKKREALFEQIINSDLIIGVGRASAKEIDQINILQATFLAMRRALNNISVVPKLLLVDGNQQLPEWHGNQKAIIKGDQLEFLIAAASIIAKVTRDKIMINLSKSLPGYYFEVHKGYGTKVHQKSLQQLGVSNEHRLTYRPIKELTRA
ncbi:MAG: ribonuclease HII [Candidatus Falkowbacteria bacterium]